MTQKRDDPASMPDDENPEWTRDEFRQARPALEVLGEAFGAEVAEGLRRGRGRPLKPESARKVNQTLRLDADVLQSFRATGAGWQARINAALREHMPSLRK